MSIIVSKDNVSLSVIVPVYNVADYLEVAVYSLLNQDCEDYEIILVEDCSTDNSRQLCIDLASKHPRVKLVCHEKNLGLGGARNSGVHRAIGKYVTFLDSDDIYSPNAIKRILEELIKYSEIDVLLTVPQIFNDSTREIYPWMDTEKYFDLPLEKIVNLKDVPEMCALEVSSCRKVYGKKFLLTNNIAFPEKLKFEDFGFHFEVLCLAHGIVLSSVESFYYRIGRPNQITGVRSASRMDICKIFESCYRFLSGVSATKEIYAHFHKWAVKFTIWNLSLIDNQHRKIFIEELYNYWSGIAHQDLYLDLLTPYEKACIKVFRSKFLISNVFSTAYSHNVYNQLAKRFSLIRLILGKFY